MAILQPQNTTRFCDLILLKCEEKDTMCLTCLTCLAIFPVKNPRYPNVLEEYLLKAYGIWLWSANNCNLLHSKATVQWLHPSSMHINPNTFQHSHLAIYIPWWHQIHLHPRNLHMIFFTAILSHEPWYQHHSICLSKGPCLHQPVHLDTTFSLRELGAFARYHLVPKNMKINETNRLTNSHERSLNAWNLNF